jgi:hypothetical protein
MEQSLPNQRGHGVDRRRRPTRPWDFLSTPARRGTIRRLDDSTSGPYHFVDRHGPSTIFWTLSLLLLTLLDGVLTLMIIDDHRGEANPFMACLIKRGADWFIIGKYLMTVAALPVLLIFKNYRMFRTRFLVGQAIPILVVLYVSLTLCSSVVLLHDLADSRPRLERSVTESNRFRLGEARGIQESSPR